MISDPSVTTKKTRKSIAVLPFVNMSTETDNEYFSDGITEEIINALTKIEGLKVIARTSSFAFKGKNLDVREIGNQLGVNSILEGSVRKSVNRVRVTAQLINTEDGSHFWSKNFDRELKDIFALQDEISLLIANQIRENFGHFDIQEQLVIKPTKNMEAYELYLKGHYYQLKWDAESILKAIQFYEEAVQKDNTFAGAFYGLVQSYGLMAAWGYMSSEEGYSKAIQNFMIASDIDKTLPEYGLSFVGQSFWMNWDFQSTYKQLVESLNKHPNYTDGLEAMAELFIANGFWLQAEEYIQRALNVDPLSANHFYTLAHINYYQKKFAKALKFVEKALQINPDFVLAYELKTLCLIWLNRKVDFEDFIAAQSNAPLKKMLFDVINKKNIELAPATFTQWQKVAKDNHQMVPYELFILSNTIHKKEAFDLLKEYIARKRGQLINFRQDPFLEPLHSFKEFHKLHVSNFKFEEDKEKPAEKFLSSKTKTSELEIQMKKLMEVIENDKPYLDAQISLSSLAKSVQLHPNRLSYLINEKAEMNFNEFVNQFRLAHFKKTAIDPDNAHLTILALAYESGFNSKTVFNAYFKKIESITPGDWIKSTVK